MISVNKRFSGKNFNAIALGLPGGEATLHGGRFDNG